MPFSSHKTANYRVIADSGGRRYQFFCDGSGALVCTSAPIHAEPPEKELLLAWETEGKHHFNQCHRCGRWVSDVMYNADVMQCVDCSPWEGKPRFCHKCGSCVSLSDAFCSKCGAQLQYEEVIPDDS